MSNLNSGTSSRTRPSYANIMSTLAVVIALTTGTAYAAGIGKNAVKAKHIANNAVQARHVSNGAVQGDDLATGAVGSRAIGNGAVGADDLGDNSVGAGEIAADSVGASEIIGSSIGAAELGADSVRSSEIAAGVVGTSEIADGSITATDVAPNAISSTRMTEGVKNLLFNAGTIAVNAVTADFTLSSNAFPGGAPNSGAQITSTWTQPADTIEVVSGIARVSYPASCSQTASAPGRGFDVKITDAAGRVISANSPTREGGANYNGNGFWDQQTALDGVSYRAPFGTELADSPAAFVDYIHLPFEMAEQISGGSSASRTVRVWFKRSSSACSPTITDARIIVYRYAL